MFIKKTVLCCVAVFACVATATADVDTKASAIELIARYAAPGMTSSVSSSLLLDTTFLSSLPDLHPTELQVLHNRLEQNNNNKEINKDSKVTVNKEKANKMGEDQLRKTVSDAVNELTHSRVHLNTDTFAKANEASCPQGQFLYTTPSWSHGYCLDCISNCNSPCPAVWNNTYTSGYCSSCDQGYSLYVRYTDASSTPHGYCQSCDYNTYRCSKTVGCPATVDYSLYGESCTECEADSVFIDENGDGKGYCIGCMENCMSECPKTANTTNYCTACESGHYLVDENEDGRGFCTSCSQSCASECPSKSNSYDYCTSCKSGYVLYDYNDDGIGWCNECDQGCGSECPSKSNSYDYCTACNSGYFLVLAYGGAGDTGFCEKCGHGCASECPLVSSSYYYCAACVEGYAFREEYMGLGTCKRINPSRILSLLAMIFG